MDRSNIMQMNSGDKTKNQLICVVGHTAGGKTAFAARLAKAVNAEIISADSRQVYRDMDIGTGKDFDDYIVDGKNIPYHLIDIVDPGYEYNVFEFQKDFLHSFNDIKRRGKNALLCGGSGMYIEAVLKGYKLINVPPNDKLRQELKEMSHGQLVERLKSFKKLHNKTDTENRKRLLRAIEIEEYYEKNPELEDSYPEIEALLFGIRYDRETRRKRITERLKARLNGGMIEEAQKLIERGVAFDKLEYYGLEYKYLALYLKGDLSYEEMFSKLNTAIHQFAKRQMTWFRKMEREGYTIHWLEGNFSEDEKLDIALEKCKDFIS